MAKIDNRPRFRARAARAAARVDEPVSRAPWSPWLTLREAERYARVQHGTILEAARRGEIACYRRAAGTAVLVHAASVDAWIRNHWAALGGGSPADLEYDGRCGEEGELPEVRVLSPEAEYDGRGRRGAGAHMAADPDLVCLAHADLEYGGGDACR